MDSSLWSVLWAPHPFLRVHQLTSVASMTAGPNNFAHFPTEFFLQTLGLFFFQLPPYKSVQYCFWRQERIVLFKDEMLI